MRHEARTYCVKKFICIRLGSKSTFQKHELRKIVKLLPTLMLNSITDKASIVGTDSTINTNMLY